MTIASEISRLQCAKADICTAIENKWVTVWNITIDNYACCIDEIPTGSNEKFIDVLLVWAWGTWWLCWWWGWGWEVICLKKHILEYDNPIVSVGTSATCLWKLIAYRWGNWINCWVNYWFVWNCWPALNWWGWGWWGSTCWISTWWTSRNLWHEWWWTGWYGNTVMWWYWWGWGAWTPWCPAYEWSCYNNCRSWFWWRWIQTDFSWKVECFAWWWSWFWWSPASYALRNSNPPLTCWTWGTWNSCTSASCRAWAWWIVIIRYPSDWSYWIENAEWWEKYECNWYTYHCFKCNSLFKTAPITWCNISYMVIWWWWGWSCCWWGWGWGAVCYWTTQLPSNSICIQVWLWGNWWYVVWCTWWDSCIWDIIVAKWWQWWQCKKWWCSWSWFAWGDQEYIWWCKSWWWWGWAWGIWYNVLTNCNTNYMSMWWDWWEWILWVWGWWWWAWYNRIIDWNWLWKDCGADWYLPYYSPHCRCAVRWWWGGWWWDGSCPQAKWFCWYAQIMYPCDWSFWFTTATWWDSCYLQWDICVHIFYSNGTFCIVS